MRDFDDPIKISMVHLVLCIAVTWCGVDESTLKTFFFNLTKKKKKANTYYFSIISLRKIVLRFELELSTSMTKGWKCY